MTEGSPERHLSPLSARAALPDRPRRWWDGPLAALATGGIYAYRLTLKRYFVWQGRRCLYDPTCSEYARLALAKYSFADAVRKSYHRYLSCNSFSDRPWLDPP